MATIAPLKEQCPDCSGFGFVAEPVGGGWHDERRCDECNGEGEVALDCIGFGCDAPATSIVEGDPLCAECGGIDDLARLVAAPVRIAPGDVGSVWL